MRWRCTDRALALGASIEMMQRYFGLDSSEVSGRRRLGGIRTRKGRSSAADAELESVLWSQWQKSGAGTPDSAESLDVMMLMAETHGVNLTTIWTLVKAWCAAEKREVT
ncbi:STY4526/YPO1902 family pathogenicity island replication protein [Salmonella enterica]